MTTTSTSRNHGRTPKASTQSIPTTPKARKRKRDRIRAAAKNRTFGVSTIAVIGTVALGALGYLGFRKIDAERLKADPTAKPLADEIVDRASSMAGDVRDKATTIASDVKGRAATLASEVSGRASATVHDLGVKTGAIKDRIADEAQEAADEIRRRG